jgi:hypothetical protein
MDTTNPSANLTDEHCDCLNRVLQRTPALNDLAHKCEQCGWDVSAAKETLQEQMNIARKAKQVFFPNNP